MVSFSFRISTFFRINECIFNDFLEIKDGVSNRVTTNVVYVFDGDTFGVKVGDKFVTVRLDAIDCPEGDQEWGDVATAGLIKMIGGKEVELEIHGEDIYGRTLATAYVNDGVDWINVNEAMVMKGHAWVYRSYYQHLPEYRRQHLVRIERWARSKGAGLWRFENPVAPWLWRKVAS